MIVTRPVPILLAFFDNRSIPTYCYIASLQYGEYGALRVFFNDQRTTYGMRRSLFMKPQHRKNFGSFLLTLGIHSFTVGLAVCASWLVSDLLQVSTVMRRVTLLTIVVLSIAVSGAVVNWLMQKSFKRSIHCMKLLCQTNYLDLDEQAPMSDLIDSNLPLMWRKALEPLGNQLRDCAVRLKEAEQARAKAEVKAKRVAGEHRQLKEILDGLQDPVVAVNGFNELSYVNASAAALFEIASESAEARPMERLLHCEQLVNLLLETNQHRAQSIRTTEATVAEASGVENWYRIRCRGLGGVESEGPSATSSGAVAVLRDINEQKHIQRRNAEFVSAVSHEMKTPLTGIKAYVELLADGDAEDEQTREEFLGVINSQADRLRRLIDNMLDLARIEAGVVEVHKLQISLNELLERAVEVVAPSAEQKNISLIAELSPMYLGVLADHDMMLQAAINLLSNAIKYTPEGGQVRLRSRLLGADIAFEVEDTGVGLTAEDCERVFDKFYRVKKDQKMASGTGLGLPLAKHIVEDVHGGCLEVESELGVGSTFRITLTEQASVPALV